VSYNVSDKSGEAVAFDPTILIPFGGIGKGLSVVQPILTKIYREGVLRGRGVQAIQKASAPIKIPITTQIKNLLGGFTKSPTKTIAGAGVAGGAVGAATVIPKGVSTGTKTLIGAGLVSVPLTYGIATFNTPQGQEAFKDITKLADKTIDATQDFGEFLKANGQLLTIFLIIAGGALLVGAIKK
jgi:hypothetical protein